jgi:hypothetical protein
MKKNLFTQLALAGLASGLVTLAAQANEDKAAPVTSTTAAAKPAAKMMKHAADSSAAVKPAAKMVKPVADTSAAVAAAPVAAPTKHACKAQNECKGLGGCAMSQKDLDAAAKKMGMKVDKAGKAHECKGHNECKGLGGCKMS